MNVNNSDEGQAHFELVFSFICSLFSDCNEFFENAIRNNCGEKENEIKVSSEKFSVKDAANYLLDLYEVLNSQYEVSLIKIQKLIFISLLKYYKKNNCSFLDTDTEFQFYWCGFKIPEIDSLNRLFYIGSKIENKDICIDESQKEEINNVKFENDAFNTEQYKEIKELLKNTFLKFASYDSYFLGSSLDALKENINFEENELFTVNSNKFKLILNNVNIIDDSCLDNEVDNSNDINNKFDNVKKEIFRYIVL